MRGDSIGLARRRAGPSTVRSRARAPPWALCKCWAELFQLTAHRTRLSLRALLDRHRHEGRVTPIMVIIKSIASMATVIIISVPIIISSADTTVIMLDLAMIVMTMMTTIIGARGNDGGAASGGEHGGAAGKKLDFWDLVTTALELGVPPVPRGPYRLVVRTSRCGRDNPGSTPGEDIFGVMRGETQHCAARNRNAAPTFLSPSGVDGRCGGAWCRTEVRGSGYPGRPGYGGIGAADAERHVYERASVRHHHETLHIWNHYFALGPNTSVLATLRIEHHTTRRLIAAARQAMLMHTQTT
jgi:hypothetical protein